VVDARDLIGDANATAMTATLIALEKCVEFFIVSNSSFLRFIKQVSHFSQTAGFRIEARAAWVVASCESIPFLEKEGNRQETVVDGTGDGVF